MAVGTGFWDKWTKDALNWWDYEDEGKVDFGPPADGEVALQVFQQFRISVILPQVCEPGPIQPCLYFPVLLLGL